MELIYLWIDHYANIIKKGFNFSSEYNINYDDGNLIIKKKEAKTISLFHENFLNITALIGENGSGKTSLLSFIEYFFLHNRTGHYNICILIVRNSEGMLIIHDDRYSSEGPLQLIANETPHIYQKIKFEEIYNFIQPIYYSGGTEINKNRTEKSFYWNFSSIEFLKYSIAKTNQDLIANYDNVTLRFNDTKKDRENELEFQKNKETIISHTSPIQDYLENELKTKLDFICKHNLEDYDFLPKYMELRINMKFYFNEVSFSLIEKFGLQDAFVDAYKRGFSNANELEPKLLFKEILLFSVYLFLLKYNDTNTFNNTDFNDLSEKLAEVDGISKKSEFIQEILSKTNLSFSGWHFEKKPLQDFVKNIDSYLDKLTYYESWGKELFIKIDDHLKDFINNLFAFWNLEDFVFKFDWLDMSSGQSAILTLFSRLYSSGKRVVEENKTIWLFIDEGEVYIHPEWQRRFFNDLHKFLPKFYPKNKIQLIISTHSPYVASDIPKNNIIMLKRAKNTACEIVDMATIPETFGANIHELLAHSFFMENGTIGEFAKDIINDLFNFLTDKETHRKWDEIIAKNVIQIVGEPIIKDQLLMLYDLKFKTTSEAEYLLSQKERIEARLKEIGQNDKNTAE